MKKICAKCKQQKHADCFHKSAERKDGLHPYCKDCRKQENPRPDYKRKWYEENREITLSRAKNRYKENEEETKKYKKEYYQKNQEKEIARTKFHYYLDHEKTKEKRREKSKTSEAKAYRKEYYKKHPYRWACRTAVRRTLRWLAQQKTEKTHILLGYTADELKTHIEKLWTTGMTWENYGEWHIDHIKPISSFSKTTSVAEINALSNLQPLWATTRIIDGIKYEGNLNKWIK